MTSKWWNVNKMKSVSFHCLYFVYMASMINDKIIWTFNYHYQWLKNDYKSFDININKPTPPPTYLPTYLPTHQVTNLPIYPPTPYLHTYIPIYLHTYLPNYLLTTYHKCQCYGVRSYECSSIICNELAPNT
jgi:hypothetical protein